MRSAKKFLMVAAMAVMGIGFGFSQKKEEKIRLELNVADAYFFGLSGHGNTVDLGFEITTNNNMIGARLGVMLRSVDKAWGSDETDDYEINLFPYAGITFSNVCFMIGAIPYYNENLLEAWLPYCGFNWDFDIIPIEPGPSQSIALRIGMDTYLDIVKPTADPMLNFFASLLSISMPKAYIGVNFKFGYGW